MSDTLPPYTRFARWLEDQLAALEENVTDFARRSDIHRSVVARWKSGSHRPDVDNARRLAEATGRPLLEVLVVAEIMTEDEAKLQTAGVDPGALTSEQLLGELSRRLGDTPRRRSVSAGPGRTPLHEPGDGDGDPGRAAGT
ncbi:helix-turn-helix domain-containing protein [Actinophytocola sediminis]